MSVRLIDQGESIASVHGGELYAARGAIYRQLAYENDKLS